MYEVFRAMKTLNFEWKILNPYHVIVRKTVKDPTGLETVSIMNNYILSLRKLYVFFEANLVENYPKYKTMYDEF